jgi:hypothetical protein
MNRFSKLATGALSVTLLLTAAQKSSAQTYITIDGRDELNLGSEGNHATYHGPAVSYAFTFGSVTAQNSADAGANPSGPTSDFNYTSPGSSGSAGIGFGISDVSVPQTAYLELQVTVNPGNAITSLTGDIKEADGDEYQYSLPLPASGYADVFVPLTATGYQGSVGDNIPDDSPLEEIQLQYPYAAGVAMNVTVHSLQIVAPEPASLGLLGLVVPALSMRRRKA